MSTDIIATGTNWRYLFCFIRIAEEAWPPSFYEIRLKEGYIYSWDAMFSPPFKTDSEVLRLVFPVLIRAILFILGMTFAVIDFDGDAPQNPEKMVFVALCLYGFISTIMVLLSKTQLKTTYLFSSGIPFLARFAWFCYDVWVPSALASFILYMHFEKDKKEMTLRLYGFNFAAMLFEVILNQMVLLPCHMLFYNVMVIPFGAYYAKHFGANAQETFFGFIVLELSYIVVFIVTYLRGNLQRHHPLAYPIISIPIEPEKKEEEKTLSWFKKTQEV
jgi:hypothetical protein